MCHYTLYSFVVVVVVGDHHLVYTWSTVCWCFPLFCRGVSVQSIQWTLPYDTLYPSDTCVVCSNRVPVNWVVLLAQLREERGMSIDSRVSTREYGMAKTRSLDFFLKFSQSTYSFVCRYVQQKHGVVESKKIKNKVVCGG